MILGLDMSTSKSGFALFDGDKLVEYGVWEMPDNIIKWRERAVWMGEVVDKKCKEHPIHQVYCEDVPLSAVNPQTLLILGALQGVVLSVCVRNNIKADFIPVSTWRSTLGLFSGTRAGVTREALKKSSIELANKQFGLNLIWKSKSSKFNQDDIADAINVAFSQICPRQEPKKAPLGKKAKVKL